MSVRAWRQDEGAPSSRGGQKQQAWQHGALRRASARAASSRRRHCCRTIACERCANETLATYSGWQSVLLRRFQGEALVDSHTSFKSSAWSFCKVAARLVGGRRLVSKADDSTGGLSQVAQAVGQRLRCSRAIRPALLVQNASDAAQLTGHRRRASRSCRAPRRRGDAHATRLQALPRLGASSQTERGGANSSTTASRMAHC